jgi:hypothetical protein
MGELRPDHTLTHVLMVLECVLRDFAEPFSEPSQFGE